LGISKLLSNTTDRILEKGETLEVLLSIGFGILVIAFRLIPISTGKRKAGATIFMGMIALLIGMFYYLFPVFPGLGNVLKNTVAQPLMIMGIVMLIQDSIENNPADRFLLRNYIWWTVLFGILCIFSYLFYWSIWVQKLNIFALVIVSVAFLFFIIQWLFKIKIKTTIPIKTQKLDKHQTMIREYITRMSKKLWIWLGSAAFTIFGIIANRIWPNPLPWPVYLVFLMIGVIIAGYQVFSDISKEITKLTKHIRELEDTTPHITIGFDQQGKLVDSAIIEFNIPVEPNYDEEVKKNEKRLLATFNQQSTSVNHTFLFASGIRPNPDYTRDVGIYLDKYRDYLKRLYEYNLTKQRVIQIHLVAENTGMTAADNVTIEIRLPMGWEFATGEQVLLSELSEPAPPDEPQVQLSFMNLILGNSMVHSFPWLATKGATIPKIKGPTHNAKDGTVVKYEIIQLVPNLLETEFKPFAIWLGEIQRDEVIQINVKVYAAQLPKPKEQVITLHLQMKDNKPPI
jgi:hypothetical protein